MYAPLKIYTQLAFNMKIAQHKILILIVHKNIILTMINSVFLHLDFKIVWRYFYCNK